MSRVMRHRPLRVKLTLLLAQNSMRQAMATLKPRT